MGYTHYFDTYRDATKQEMLTIANLAENLPTKFADVEISVEDNLTVMIRGKLESCETFVFDGRKKWDSCKTRRLDYDDYVVAMLYGIKAIMGEAFDFSSDGDLHELANGLQLLRETDVTLDVDPMYPPDH